MGKKIEGISESRASSLGYSRLKSIDRHWDNSERRMRRITDAIHFFESFRHFPRLFRFASMLDPLMDRRSLWSVLVPLERTSARSRITDAELLEGDVCRKGIVERMPVTVVIDSVRSALNLGGIIRSCECFGIDRMVLSGYTADLDNPRVLRSSMGCEKSVSWEREDDICRAVGSLKGDGIQVVALETTGNAVEVSAFDFTFPSAVVIGNERFGVTPSALSLCDAVVCIDMHGSKNSLNVVSAFSICAYALRRRYAFLKDDG